MIVRLIYNYIKKRKAEKDRQWLMDYVEKHPVEKTITTHEEVQEKEDDVSTAFNLTDSVDLTISDEIYTLTLEHKSKDWEGDDILLSISSKANTYIHPQTFFQHTVSCECSYLKNQDNQFIKNIENSTWFKFTYLEDSRDYPSISIEGNELLIKCHYLCPIFYISIIKDKIIMVVDNLFDENMEEIPQIFTEISTDLFNKTSAIYDNDEEMWLHTDA